MPASLIVANLTGGDLERRLAGTGLRLRTGPVVTVIQSSIPAVVQGIRLQYAQHPVAPADGFADFHVEISPASGIRRFVRPQVFFRFEGTESFRPLPLDQAFPMLEWGLNWCVSSHCNQFLIVHAAVVARDGRAVVLPAPPGSGKSTLCAALMLRGWRLLSDELALFDPLTGALRAIPRPVSLKNASIEVIRGFSTDAVLGPSVSETTKGTVAHLKPSVESVQAAPEPAQPAWIVFPRYERGAEATWSPLSRAQGFMRLVDNAFNYDLHGRHGFEAFANIVDGCDCFEFSYALLDDAIAAFDALSDPR